MKLGQLIEYNMRNIFFKKWYTKCVGESIPRLFSQKPKRNIGLGQWSELYGSLF